MPIHARRTVIWALSFILVLSLALPTATMAAKGLQTRTDSTFRLLPGQDRIRATVQVKLTNRKPSTTRIGPCSAGSAQRCRITTDYYFDKWGYIYMPPGATNIKFSPGVNQRLAKETKHWKQFEVSFPNLDFGRTRTFTVTYELAGEKPRSQHRTRVMDAYTYFCWHGEPGDSGKVTASLPIGFEATTFGEKTRTKTSKKGTVITAVFKGSPSKFYACTDAFKPAKLLRTEVTSPSGQLVTFEGWPEDPEWSERMVEVVEESLPRLEALIGRAMPMDEIVIREVTEQSLYGYGSEFGVRRALIRLGEHIEDPSLALRGLAMAWFNRRSVGDEWLSFGLARWAGMHAAGLRCWPAGDYPGKGKPNLRQWKQLRSKPTEQQEAVVAWQYDAACEIVEDMAEGIGEDGMHAVIAALLDGTSPYGRQPGARVGKSKPATWRDWLDAVDELGLVANGETDLTVAERALKELGIASNKSLKGRAGARATYHEALAKMDGTQMPRLVTDAMDRWDWKAARTALPRAEAAYAAIMENESMSEPDRAGYLADFEAARTAKALRSVQTKAANHVSVEPEPGTDAAIDEDPPVAGDATA